MSFSLKTESDPKFVRDSNSSLVLLTFQLSDVRELEAIEYAFSLNVSCYLSAQNTSNLRKPIVFTSPDVMFIINFQQNSVQLDFHFHLIEPRRETYLSPSKFFYFGAEARQIDSFSADIHIKSNTQCTDLNFISDQCSHDLPCISHC